MIKKQFTIIKETGFARPATLLVSLSHRFTSDIFLKYRGKTVNLKHSPKSIMDIMGLGIKPGTQIYIQANGADEAQAIQYIKDYLIKRDYVQET
ncbi:HPr family phosphocarrier protein [Bacillus inaquosorum]|uniref:HPr family phosphocarrier protein n=1 Tax=Bacillus inaquosorum TaxID=483913 RepID=UPI002280F8B9|nr:HPr family phosphocarrier protein [Bacillus inaquosorum]MCY9176231.1 HPr family phosphocarrier protein [Bacillus inaquosorum]